MKGIELIEKLRASRHWDNIAAAMGGTGELSVNARDYIFAVAAAPGQAEWTAALESVATTAPVHVEAEVPMMAEAQAYVDLAYNSYAGEIMCKINSGHSEQSGNIDANQPGTEKDDKG